MAVPVGPRPRSVSAQVRRSVSRYPVSKPAWATGRMDLSASSSARPTQTMAWPQSSTTIRHTSSRSSGSQDACSMACELLLRARSVRLRLRSSSLSVRSAAVLAAAERRSAAVSV